MIFFSNTIPLKYQKIMLLMTLPFYEKFSRPWATLVGTAQFPLYMDFFFFFNRKFYITRWSEAGSIMDSEPWIWRNRGYRGLALRLYTDFPRCWGLNNAQPLPALFKRRLWFLGRSPFGLWKETLDSGRRPTGEISQKSISFLLLCLATFLVRGDEEASWLISGYDTIFRFSTNCS